LIDNAQQRGGGWHFVICVICRGGSLC